MTTKTLPPCLPSRRSSRFRRSRSSTTKFPSINQVPRPTLVSPDFAHLDPRYRIEVLHPPTTKRRTVALETGRQHLHLSDRSGTMQRREMKTRHGEWKKPFYGSPTVKEIYRSNVRSALKTQIKDQTLRRREDFENQLNQSIQIFERDKRHRYEDWKKHRDKIQFMLVTFTRENQKTMEMQWKDRRVNRLKEAKFERELLKQNPINWSCTLK